MQCVLRAYGVERRPSDINFARPVFVTCGSLRCLDWDRMVLLACGPAGKWSCMRSGSKGGAGSIFCNNVGRNSSVKPTSVLLVFVWSRCKPFAIFTTLSYNPSPPSTILTRHCCDPLITLTTIPALSQNVSQLATACWFFPASFPSSLLAGCMSSCGKA